MTRTQDPRQFYRHRKAKIVGGQPTCKECGQPATEIALPSGTPVCAKHGDSRTV